MIFKFPAAEIPQPAQTGTLAKNEVNRPSYSITGKISLEAEIKRNSQFPTLRPAPVRVSMPIGEFDKDPYAIAAPTLGAISFAAAVTILATYGPKMAEALEAVAVAGEAAVAEEGAWAALVLLL